MPDRADLLRRIDKALATPPQRMNAAYALNLLRETRAALAAEEPAGAPMLPCWPPLCPDDFGGSDHD
jgi:hypothetical protein